MGAPDQRLSIAAWSSSVGGLFLALGRSFISIAVIKQPEIALPFRRRTQCILTDCFPSKNKIPDKPFLSGDSGYRIC